MGLSNHDEVLAASQQFTEAENGETTLGGGANQSATIGHEQDMDTQAMVGAEDATEPYAGAEDIEKREESAEAISRPEFGRMLF